MIYEEFAPAPELAGAVSYWRFAVPESPTNASVLHTIPPDGAVGLVWLPQGIAKLVGPRVSALRVPVDPGSEYIGIRFLPGSAGPLLGCDVRAIRDSVAPFEDEAFTSAMRSRGIAGLNEAVLLRASRNQWAGRDAVVAELARRIVESNGALPVAALTDRLNLSYRQILRRFHEAVGLTPKEFARIRRLRAACLKALRYKEPQWAGVSADAGFSDQAHLSREFQDIYGWPPRLVHEYLRRIDHVKLIG